MKSVEAAIRDSLHPLSYLVLSRSHNEDFCESIEDLVWKRLSDISIYEISLENDLEFIMYFFNQWIYELKAQAAECFWAQIPNSRSPAVFNACTLELQKIAFGLERLSTAIKWRMEDFVY